MRIAPTPATVRRSIRRSAFDGPNAMFVVNADEGASDASPPK
jgi:hypothetical protein